MVPLGIIYAAAALMWRSGHDARWMWVNLAALFCLLAYAIVWSLRTGRSANGGKRPAWLRSVLHFVDNNHRFGWFGLILPIVVLALSVVSDWLHWGGIITWVLMAIASLLYLMYVMLVMFATGYEALTLLLHSKERQLAQSNRELALLRREQELASRTHDTVTGALSSIALLAEQQQGDADNDGEIRIWSIVNKTALQALDNLHQVIDILGNAPVDNNAAKGLIDKTSQSSTWDMDALMHSIQDIATKGDQELRSLGFHGTTTLRDARTSLSTETIDADSQTDSIDAAEHREEKNLKGNAPEMRDAEEVLNILGEIYTNIRFHADPTVEYQCDISIESEAIRINQTNALLTNVDGVSSKHQSERGLRLHKQILKQIGGSLKTQRDTKTWLLQIEIPVGNAQASEEL